MKIEDILETDFDEIDDEDELEKMLDTLNEAKDKHIESLKDVIENLADNDKLELYREYSEDNNYDEIYYPMDEIDDVLGNMSFSDAYNQLEPSKFNINDDVFWYERGLYIVSGSVSDYLESNFYVSDIMNWIKRNDYSVKSFKYINDSDLSDWLDYLEELNDKIEELEEYI